MKPAFDSDVIMERVKRKSYHIVNARMMSALTYAADKIVNSPIMKRVYNNEFDMGEERPLHNITGNLYKSTTASVWYFGKDKSMPYGFVTAAQPAGRNPTRLTLAQDENYMLGAFYRGDLNIGAKSKPFHGIVGSGGQNGSEEGFNKANHINKIPRRGTWFLKVSVGVDYADYEFSTYPGHNYLTALRGYVKRYWTTITSNTHTA